MFCTQCGKKVPDGSRFCFNCGVAVVQDEEFTQPSKPVAPQVSKDDYQPLDLEPARRRSTPAQRADAPAESSPGVRTAQRSGRAASSVAEPVRSAPVGNAAPKPTAQTPKRPRSLFDDEPQDSVGSYRVHISKDPSLPRVSGKQPIEEEKWAAPSSRKYIEPDHRNDPDDYDAYDDDDTDNIDDTYNDSVDYEDPSNGSFILRHFKALIILLLTLAVIIAGAMWAFSTNGQLMLARYNLAWTVDAYDSVGRTAYSNGQFAEAGAYFEKACALQPNDYELAGNAAMSYYAAGDTERSAMMTKKAIAIDPDRADAYIMLQKLYPDASARPEEITALLKDGYTRTGSSAILGK